MSTHLMRYTSLLYNEGGSRSVGSPLRYSFMLARPYRLRHEVLLDAACSRASPGRRGGEAYSESGRPRDEVQTEVSHSEERYKSESQGKDQADHEEQQVEDSDPYTVGPRAGGTPVARQSSRSDRYMHYVVQPVDGEDAKQEPVERLKRS